MLSRTYRSTKLSALLICYFLFDFVHRLSAGVPHVVNSLSDKGLYHPIIIAALTTWKRTRTTTATLTLTKLFPPLSKLSKRTTDQNLQGRMLPRTWRSLLFIRSHLRRCKCKLEMLQSENNKFFFFFFF